MIYSVRLFFLGEISLFTNQDAYLIHFLKFLKEGSLYITNKDEIDRVLINCNVPW